MNLIESKNKDIIAQYEGKIGGLKEGFYLFTIFDASNSEINETNPIGIFKKKACSEDKNFIFNLSEYLSEDPFEKR